MPIVNILNQTALTKSTDQNSANVINMYLTECQDQDKYNNMYACYPTPGATLFSAGSTVLRAIFSEHGVTYGIDGSTFFSVNSSGTRTTLGTLNTSTGWAKIRGIADQLLIADSTNLYYYQITDNVFGQPINSAFVSSVSVTAAGSGYTAPTAVISDSTGTGATVTVQTDQGQVSAITLVTPGSGYSNNPTILISDSTGTGATGLVFVDISSVPATIQDIETQDEFGLVLEKDSQVWFASSISDLTTYPILSFASTTGNQNFNQAIVSLHRELYIFGTQTTEVWDNLGQANFTFGRNTSVFIEWGCAARSSLASADNTVFWLAQSQTGGRVVMRMEGYTPKKISNRAIDYQLSTYASVSDAIGFTYQQEGHEFYVLTIPSAGVTWVYDTTTNLWHQRQSLINGSQTAWFPSCQTSNYDKIIVGDQNTGNMLYLDMTSYTENGAAITRTLQSHPFYNSGTWIYVDKMQVDFDTTPGASLSNWNLYVSRDGGYTYGSAKVASPQQDANGMWRVYWLRLGQAHAYTFKITTNAQMKTIILGAWAVMRPGAEV